MPKKTPQPEANNGERARIIIIGAGLAGLAAARLLKEKGQDVLVIEANSRVGGRTYTTEIDGRSIDLGGQWLGPGQDRMFSLLRAYGIETYKQYNTGAKFLDLAGKVSRYEGEIPTLPFLQLLDMNRCLQAVDKNIHKAPLTNPKLHKKLAERWDQMTAEQWKRKTALTPTVRGLFDAMSRTFFGAEPAEINHFWFMAYMNAGGGLERHATIEGGAQMYRVRGGAQQISQAMAGDLSPEELVLGSPVLRVDSSEDGVTVYTEREQFEGDYCIVAVPQNLVGGIDFRPALPVKRQMLAGRMVMGCTVKVYSFFEEPFWRTAGLSGEITCDSGPLSCAFDASPEDGSAGVLLGFVVGKHAYSWDELPEAERQRLVGEQYARYFGERARRPLRYLEHNWGKEQWAKGCPLASMPAGSFLDLWPSISEPVGRVHWAGTETAREWTGHMEGAVDSGYRAVREIMYRLEPERLTRGKRVRVNKSLRGR